ncbi:hypothetical protein D9H19_23370 [Escherichia coli]|nr:hypothetical protein [Escherichia coli]
MSYDYSACLSTRKEYHLLTLVVVVPDTLPLLQLCQQIGDIIRQHGQQLVWMPEIRHCGRSGNNWHRHLWMKN